jgi:hypothetical protein
MSSEKKRLWQRLTVTGVLAGAATLAGGFAAIPQLPEASAWLRHQVRPTWHGPNRATVGIASSASISSFLRRRGITRAF